jgi:hypothetical protein
MNIDEKICVTKFYMTSLKFKKKIWKCMYEKSWSVSIFTERIHPLVESFVKVSHTVLEKKLFHSKIYLFKLSFFQKLYHSPTFWNKLAQSSFLNKLVFITVTLSLPLTSPRFIASKKVRFRLLRSGRELDIHTRIC